MSEYVHHVKQRDKPLASRLGRLDIELTERCNSRCIHCYINQPEDDSCLEAREMDTAFVHDLLKQAGRSGLPVGALYRRRAALA
jgi:MoaA/NifB/PqqE/SkfB family radical SAM enzyme